jgi:hypothetical protein
MKDGSSIFFSNRRGDKQRKEVIVGRRSENLLYTNRKSSSIFLNKKGDKQE